jgi:GT2 family glycosyltransferase
MSVSLELLSVNDCAEIVDLSVILVNWNSLDVTSAALNSVREKTAGITYEVFVVDNGTTKDAGATEIPRRFPWVKFIANSANMGFTKANNQGIRQSCGRYVVLLNNDTIQTENALGESVRYMDAHADVGALGIMHRNNDVEKTFQASFFLFPKPFQDILGLMGLNRSEAYAPTVVEQNTDWVCGSFLLMRRECLEKIGPLDERFFIYDEDIDWCLRAKNAGWNIRFWPGASMIHLGAVSGPIMRDKSLTMYRSHVSYLRKHHGALWSSSFYLAMVLRLSMSWVKQGLFWLVGRSRWSDVRLRWRRLWNFLSLRPGKVGG